MKNGATIIVTALLGSYAWGAAGTNVSKVVVCIEGTNHPAELDAALTLASSMFRAAGVDLDHRGIHTFCHGQRDQVIIIGLSMNSPKTFHPGALAYAFPYEGVHIRIFYNRILGADPSLLTALLAHVIVHEVTHVLQGVDHHSSKGIMKAHWDTSDFRRMKVAQLRFTDLDLAMIQDGLAFREARRMALVAMAAP